MTIIPRLLFLLASIALIITLWSLAAHLAFPYLFKRVRPFILEKLYFGFLSFPFFFFLSCPAFCEISNWLTFISGSRLGIVMADSSHCVMTLGMTGHQYMNYCVWGVVLLAVLTLIRLKVAFKKNRYQIISLDDLPGSQRNRLKLVTSKIERQTGKKFPPVEVIISHHSRAFTEGILRYKFLVSRNLISDLQTDELESLLLHEGKHYQRKDNLRNLVILVSQSLNLWPGLRKKLLNNYNCLREIACDEGAVMSSRKPLDMAALIVKIGKLFHDKVPQVEDYLSAFAPLYGSDAQITARVHNLISLADASDDKSNYYERLSYRNKRAAWPIVFGFGFVMIMVLSAGCLENHLIHLYSLLVEVLPLA